MGRVAGPLLPGFPPSLVSSLYALPALQVSVVGSDTLDSIGVSAVWFCHGIRCHCGVLCDCPRGLVLLLSAVAGWFPHLTCWPLG